MKLLFAIPSGLFICFEVKYKTSYFVILKLWENGKVVFVEYFKNTLQEIINRFNSLAVNFLTRLWALSGSQNSKYVLYVQTIILQWEFVHKNDQIRGCGWPAFNLSQMFYPISFQSYLDSTVNLFPQRVHKVFT